MPTFFAVCQSVLKPMTTPLMAATNPTITTDTALKTSVRAPPKSGLTLSHSHVKPSPSVFKLSRNSSMSAEPAPIFLSIRSKRLSAPWAKPIRSSIASTRAATPAAITVTGRAAILTAMPKVRTAIIAFLMAFRFLSPNTSPNPTASRAKARAFSRITPTRPLKPSSTFVTPGSTSRTNTLPTSCAAILKSIHATLNARAFRLSCAVKAVLRYFAIKASSAFCPCRKIGMASSATP